MGRETRTFKQTKGTGRAEYATKLNKKIPRQGGWGKVLNIFNRNNKETR